MTANEIRERGAALGLSFAARMRKGEMVRLIQRSEGNRDCFGAEWRFDCPQLDCCWRTDCLTPNPG